MATDQIPSPLRQSSDFPARSCASATPEREILHGISFDVLQGETLVILGGFLVRKNARFFHPGGPGAAERGEI